MTDLKERVKAHQQFIGGEWVDSTSGKTLDVENPANGQVIASVPASDVEDVDRAAKAAAKAFETWQKTTPAERMTALLKLADAIDANADELAKLESAHAGKPINVAAVDIPVVADNLRFFAGAARNLEGKAANEYIADRTSIVRREPVGVVASIAPWNYPLMMAGWKIGPALAAGNTVVLKPSARTPSSGSTSSSAARPPSSSSTTPTSTSRPRPSRPPATGTRARTARRPRASSSARRSTTTS